MEYWIWIILGLSLLGAETLTSGYFLMFFGAGAILVGLLVLLGIGGPAWAQWALFSIFSVALVITMRKRLLGSQAGFRGAGDTDSPVGKTAVCADSIPAGADGNVELRGANWQAKNVGSVALSAQEKCTVVDVDGLMLLVKK